MLLQPRATAPQETERTEMRGNESRLSHLNLFGFPEPLVELALPPAVPANTPSRPPSKCINRQPLCLAIPGEGGRGGHKARRKPGEGGVSGNREPEGLWPTASGACRPSIGLWQFQTLPAEALCHEGWLEGVRSRTATSWPRVSSRETKTREPSVSCISTSGPRAGIRGCQISLGKDLTRNGPNWDLLGQITTH